MVISYLNRESYLILDFSKTCKKGHITKYIYEIKCIDSYLCLKHASHSLFIVNTHNIPSVLNELIIRNITFSSQYVVNFRASVLEI